eukprot:m.87518 g.87518  ORF g.87518 m.87518 type:complete len:295 (-) comp21407_c0_seq3:140-1024(-)
MLREVRRLCVLNRHEEALTSCLAALPPPLHSCSGRFCECFPLISTALQLYVETEQTENGINHCKSWYGTVGNIPAFIASLCALALLKNNQAHEAQSLLDEWLHSTTSLKQQSPQEKDDFQQLIQIYLFQLLLPSKQYQRFEHVVTSSSFITSAVLRQEYLDKLEKAKLAKAATKKHQNTLTADDDAKNKHSELQNGNSSLSDGETKQDRSSRHIFPLFSRILTPDQLLRLRRWISDSFASLGVHVLPAWLDLFLVSFLVVLLAAFWKLRHSTTALLGQLWAELRTALNLALATI